MEERDKPPPRPSVSDSSPKPWRARRLSVRGGEIYIATGGQVRSKQPFEFSASQENVRLDSLNSLRTSLDLAIKPTDFPLPAYELKIEGLSGSLKFGYPPERNQNNAVQKLEARKVRWRQFEGDEIWIGVTYGLHGISGRLGGKVCGGYLTGQADFFARNNWPWVAWANLSNVDLRQFKDVFTRDLLRVNGRVNASVYLNATTTTFDRILGRASALGSGTLKINKLDQLLARIDPSWPKLNADLTRIGLETLRDFDFDTATCSFWFAGEEGCIELDFRGPAGKRSVRALIHPPAHVHDPQRAATGG